MPTEEKKRDELREYIVKTYRKAIQERMVKKLDVTGKIITSLILFNFLVMVGYFLEIQFEDLHLLFTSFKNNENIHKVIFAFQLVSFVALVLTFYQWKTLIISYFSSDFNTVYIDKNTSSYVRNEEANFYFIRERYVNSYRIFGYFTIFIISLTANFFIYLYLNTALDTVVLGSLNIFLSVFFCKLLYTTSDFSKATEEEIETIEKKFNVAVSNGKRDEVDFTPFEEEDPQ